MKAVMFYYSGSGNTKLACQVIAKNVTGIEWSFFDMVRDSNPDLEKYDLVGFAAFADYLGPSRLVMRFIKSLPRQKHKPSFVFNTYGNINGHTLMKMANLLSARGFKVLAGHALHTPESYPPLVAAGKGFEDSPDENELLAFNGFIGKLNGLVNDLRDERKAKPIPLKIGILDRIMPPAPRLVGRWSMGRKFVDENRCTTCGICAKGCPYQAIEMQKLPVFDQSKCWGCWACYNHCPEKAIHTKKYLDVGHYPKPIGKLEIKLKT